MEKEREGWREERKERRHYILGKIKILSYQKEKKRKRKSKMAKKLYRTKFFSWA